MTTETKKKARTPQHIIDALSEIERILTMESASFGYSKDESEKIKKAIKPWIDTWSLEPLRDVLAWAKGEEGSVVSYYTRTPRFSRRVR